MPDGRQQRRVYWDADVFLSYVNGVADRLPDIEAILTQARRNQVQIITSVLSVAEVAFGATEQTANALDPAVEAQIDALWELGGPIQLVEMHLLTAERARELQRAGVPQRWTGLRSVDAMHLATAQREGADEFHTYDGRLVRYAPLIGMAVKHPEAQQLALGF